MKCLIVLCLACASADVCAWEPAVALTNKSFAKYGADKGVVLVHVNWGRYWNCHGYENAQLQKLVFQSMPIDVAVGQGF